MQGEIVSKWCRENLNELAAEKELRTSRKGTFLVWRCRSPVDLYLSYFDQNGLGRHLPIKQLGRHFFFEGHRFRSLPALVVHHLTLREHSANPVKIVNSRTTEKLDATHIVLADMDYLPLHPVSCVSRGDLLAEMGRLDDRWLLAKHLPSGASAFFDLTQTAVLVGNSDMDASPEALPYFHECKGGDEQDELVQQLAEGGRGSFLIRTSRHTSGAYAILVHTGDKIDKFLIEEVKAVSSTSSPCSLLKNNNNNGCMTAKSSSASGSISGWRLSGRVFPSISQIVHRYSIRPIQADVRLTHAILSQKEEEGGCYPECSSSSSTSSPSTSSGHGEEGAAMRGGGEMVEIDRNAPERVPVASVGALYKNREDKEWRACSVSLYEHAGTAILRIGDTSRSDRHSSLVLHHTELVCLHESMLAREAAVFLAPLQNEAGVFLAFEPLHFFYTWFHLLRRYTVQRRGETIGSPSSTTSSLQTTSSSMSYYAGMREGSEREEMSLLSVHVDKYKGALLKADALYRVGISVNNVGVACTPFQTPTNGSSVVFDAHFLMIVTSISCNVQLTISAAGKSRPTAVSMVLPVPVSAMTSSTSSSSSSSASSSTTSSGAIPTVLSGVERKTSGASASQQPFVVTTTRQRVVVLARDAYSPLIECLLDEVLAVAEWASGRLPTAQRNLLCSVVVSLAWPHSLRALIERTLGRSIGETAGENMLRQDSFASCLITAALRMAGKTILEASLAEERPKKEAQSEEWLVSILSEVARVPAVSLVLACVAATVSAHLPAPDKEHVVRRAVSAAFVLRFSNPLIISSLASSSGGPALARGVQTAANAATMPGFVRDPTGEGTPTRLFDLFERVRESAGQTVMVEAYDTAPEQCALLCHLLVAALTAPCPASCRHPPATAPCSSTTSSTSSSTLTTSSGSSMTSSTYSRLAPADSALTGAESEPGLSLSYVTLSSTSTSSTSASSHPELTPSLARLLELHRT